MLLTTKANFITFKVLSILSAIKCCWIYHEANTDTGISCRYQGPAIRYFREGNYNSNKIHHLFELTYISLITRVTNCCCWVLVHLLFYLADNQQARHWKSHWKYNELVIVLCYLNVSTLQAIFRFTSPSSVFFPLRFLYLTRSFYLVLLFFDYSFHWADIVYGKVLFRTVNRWLHNYLCCVICKKKWNLLSRRGKQAMCGSIDFSYMQLSVLSRLYTIFRYLYGDRSKSV